jgi:hypothetical protein
MPAPKGLPAYQIHVMVNQRDLDRIDKRLEKWQGKPLETRMAKAEQAGMALYIGPLKSRAASHNLTGATQRGYAVRKLRKRAGEVVAYKVSSNTRYRHFAIVGTSRGVKPDPYVDQVHRVLEPAVTKFIDEQVRRLA